MRILVFSDTHGNIENCVKVSNQIVGVDLIIHLGDMKSDALKIEKITGIKVEYVMGNNEFSYGKTTKILEVQNKRIFISHGHTLGVKYDKTKMAEKTKSVAADIGLFGHTHIPFDLMVGGVRLLNPGGAGIKVNSR